MKSLLLSFVILVLLFVQAYSQSNVGINDNNADPAASAMLDVNSSSKGLLIPRVALTSTTDVTTVNNPATSLLIYNTASAGDVIPGYYYWDGASKWQRLISGTGQVASAVPVMKNSNVTLLKTENMVLATGDITLTLPTVTAADNGLEISVKNIGTYTDLVTVVPQSGKVIDACPAVELTRWRSRTFIAYGTNWVLKEKEPRPDNLYDVSPIGSFATIKEVLAFLNLHMNNPSKVRLGGAHYEIDETLVINLPYPVTFEGASYGETMIDGTSGISGHPMFDCRSECYFKMLVFNAYNNASGSDAIRLNSANTYHEIKDCSFDGFNKGVVSTTSSDTWFFDIDFNDCSAAAIEIAAGSGNAGRTRISEVDFVQCGIGVNLLSGIGSTVSITNCTFINTTSGSDIGISYSPLTYKSFVSINISNNAWNNQGSFYSGFDFTRSDGRDADVFMMNNVGIENQSPHCKISVNDNVSTTTISSAGTYYKANWTNTSSHTCKWTISNNRITYQPTSKSEIYAVITGNIAVNSSNRVVTIAIFKNGSVSNRYGETNLRITTGNQPFQFSTVIQVPSVAKNDYFELGVTSSSNGDVVTFQDVQWYTTSD